MTTDAGPTESSRYEYLAQRALEFVQFRGGIVAEDEIVRHVFGQAASAKLWAPLLRTVLGAEERLVLRSDGAWALAEQALATPVAGALRDFVALDVETTGLRPLQHRIIEIAAIRYRDGLVAQRYERLLDPGMRIPQMISRLTGIRDEDVAGQGTFADIADEVLEFLGEDLIVGHNVAFDISFVGGELKRLGRPGLGNARFCTLMAANRVLVGVRRKNLVQVASFVGVPMGHAHRGGEDARVAAEVAFKLVELARAKGIAGDDEVLALGRAGGRGQKDGNLHRRATLDRTILADIPRAPGVYLMEDAHGHVIYVGKAKNLRDRVGSYFSQQLGYTRKMDGLLESLVSIRTEVTGSELEALLLESQLIRFYQPRYNTALRTSELYPYIRVDVSNPWPRVTLSKERREDGAQYYGPYRSKSAARRAVDLINDTLPLRTCPRSFKDAKSLGKPCIRLDLAQCLGPCMGVADRTEYRGLVREVEAFLGGDPTAIEGRLWAGLEDAAQRLDFEKARRLQADVQLVQGLAEAQRRMREAVVRHTLLLVLPSPETRAREIMLVIEGRRWAQIRARDGEAARDIAARLAGAFGRYQVAGPPMVDHASLDDTLILNRWLFANTGHPAILPFDRDDPALDWRLLAERALALTDADLHAVVVRETSGDDPLSVADADLLLAERTIDVANDDHAFVPSDTNAELGIATT